MRLFIDDAMRYLSLVGKKLFYRGELLDIERVPLLGSISQLDME
jgi:hypothetical protein